MQSQSALARSNTSYGYKPSLKPLKPSIKFGNEGFIHFIGEIEPNSFVLSGAIGNGLFALTGKVFKTAYRTIFRKPSPDKRMKSIESKLEQLLKEHQKTAANVAAKEGKGGWGEWLAQIPSWFSFKQENITPPAAAKTPPKK